MRTINEKVHVNYTASCGQAFSRVAVSLLLFSRLVDNHHAAHSTDILNPTPIAEHAAKLQFLLQNVSRKVTIREAGEKKSEALMAAEAMDDDVDGTVMMRVFASEMVTLRSQYARKHMVSSRLSVARVAINMSAYSELHVH